MDRIQKIILISIISIGSNFLGVIERSGRYDGRHDEL